MMSLRLCLASILLTVLIGVSPAAAITVESAGATGITSTAASFCGDLTVTNGTTNAVTARLCYGTSDGTTNMTWWGYTNHVVTLTATGAFSTNLTGLLPTTHYFYRLYAAEGTNTDWSSATNFWTLASLPTSAPPTISYYPLMLDTNGDLASPTNVRSGNLILPLTQGVESNSNRLNDLEVNTNLWNEALTNGCPVQSNAFDVSRTADHRIRIAINTNLSGLFDDIGFVNDAEMTAESNRVNVIEASTNLWNAATNCVVRYDANWNYCANYGTDIETALSALTAGGILRVGPGIYHITNLGYEPSFNYSVIGSGAETTRILLDSGSDFGQASAGCTGILAHCTLEVTGTIGGQVPIHIPEGVFVLESVRHTSMVETYPIYSVELCGGTAVIINSVLDRPVNIPAGSSVIQSGGAFSIVAEAGSFFTTWDTPNVLRSLADQTLPTNAWVELTPATSTNPASRGYVDLRDSVVNSNLVSVSNLVTISLQWTNQILRYDMFGNFITNHGTDYSAALTACGASNILAIGPGDYTVAEDTDPPAVPDGVRVIGAGMDATRIYVDSASTDGAALKLGHNSLVQGLSLYNWTGMGIRADQFSTNVVMRDVRVRGFDCCIYLSNIPIVGSSDVTAYGCQFESSLYISEITGCDQSTFAFHGCQFRVRPYRAGASGACYGLYSDATNQIIVHGGLIDIAGGIGSGCIGVVAGSCPTVSLYGVTIQVATETGSYAIQNTGGTVLEQGCLYSNAVNGTITHGTLKTATAMDAAECVPKSQLESYAYPLVGNPSNYWVEAVARQVVAMLASNNAYAGGTTQTADYVVCTNVAIGGAPNASYRIYIYRTGAATEARIHNPDSGGYTRLQLKNHNAGLGQINFGDSGSDTAGYLLYTHSTDVMTIGVGNVGLMRIASNALALATNLVPPGGIAGHAGLYSLDSSGTSELWAYDSSGNDTQLSTHDADTAIHYSHNKLSGRWRRIDLDAQGAGRPPAEWYSGGYRMPTHTWADMQAEAAARRNADRAQWTARKTEYDNWTPDPKRPDFQRPSEPGPQPPEYVPVPEPDWLVSRLRDDNPHTSAAAWGKLSAADRVGIPRPAADAWRQYIRVRQIDE